LSNTLVNLIAKVYLIPQNNASPVINSLIYPRVRISGIIQVMKKEAIQRKATPIYSGVLKYFPDAIKEVARVSQAGNDQHHKNKPLHWDRSKSTDELDALTRHLVDHASGHELDTDGQRHLAKVVWRALAMLQKELEK